MKRVACDRCRACGVCGGSGYIEVYEPPVFVPRFSGLAFRSRARFQERHEYIIRMVSKRVPQKAIAPLVGLERSTLNHHVTIHKQARCYCGR